MKNLLYYSVAGTIIGLIAQALGAGLGVTLIASLIGLPLLLSAFRIFGYNAR